MSANLYGANIPQNETLAGAIAAGGFFIALHYNFIQDINLWILAVMVTSPSAVLCKRVQEWLDRSEYHYSNRAVTVEARKPIRLSLFITAFDYVSCFGLFSDRLFGHLGIDRDFSLCSGENASANLNTNDDADWQLHLASHCTRGKFVYGAPSLVHWTVRLKFFVF